MKRTTCSPIVGQFFDTMIEASSAKKWPCAIVAHQNVNAGNCFEPPLAPMYRFMPSNSTNQNRRKFSGEL